MLISRIRNRLASAVLACLCVMPALAERPNIIVILTDDQGYKDVGFNGSQDIPTPNIDRIAHEGALFTRGYVTHPVCGPSRAGLMTGRYQARFGFGRNPTLNPAVEHASIPLEETTLAEALDPAGYANLAVGKWHLGSHPTRYPRKRGFDEFFGFLSGGHDYFPENLTLQDMSEVKGHGDWYRTKILHNGERIEIDDYLTDELSNAAVEFIHRRKDELFFIYLAYNAPHTPMQATEKYLSRFENIQDKTRRTYAAMVSAVDDGVGRVLQALEDNGLANNTMVFFLSDNGGPSSNGSNNAPLRGGKGNYFEGGVRVPFAMRWTGTIPAGLIYDKPISSLDIFATAVAHAGPGAKIDKHLDGVDLVPYLTGANDGVPHKYLFWRGFKNSSQTVLSMDSKLIIHPRKYAQPMLFDLGSDQAETTNLSDKDSVQLIELTKQHELWNAPNIETTFPGLGAWFQDRNK